LGEKVGTIPWAEVKQSKWLLLSALSINKAKMHKDEKLRTS